nr:MAG TPA: hypothetical protein [Caudoviricetes sp.]
MVPVRHDYGPLFVLLTLILLPVWLPLLALFWLCNHA